jgi:lipoprotein-anchoring transpeptidase ErfK/SrfK
MKDVPIMRRLAALLLFAAGFLFSALTADAAVQVRIDKSTQRMTVAIDGRPAYVWAVSTGRGGFGTPTGHFRPQWLARRWFSTKYYGSPMPHSIFFHKGYAIHGTNYISRLGGVASHGCVRLHPAAAATLFGLVQRAGLRNTSIVITGGNPGGIVKRRARSAQFSH